MLLSFLFFFRSASLQICFFLWVSSSSPLLQVVGGKEEEKGSTCVGQLQVCRRYYVLVVARGWLKKRELGLGLAEMGEAGDGVCGAGLLCQWAATLVWPIDEGDALDGWGKNSWGKGQCEAGLWGLC
jgi:hypothetical protein